ncbi:hypothetical protein [Acinetobacter sp.]|uniref:hypothetical protein n=1 Tax=Acinetobacter sp. TaxID=472 RepID=UPI003D07D6A9
MAKKLKIRLLDQDNLSATTKQWLDNYKITFDKNGYADAPRIPNSGLYGDGYSFNVPYDPNVLVYQTLDHLMYYTDGQHPSLEKKRMVVHPLKSVETTGDSLRIVRHFIIRGAEVAQLVEEVLYEGLNINLEPPWRVILDAHTRAQLAILKAKQEAQQAKANNITPDKSKGYRRGGNRDHKKTRNTAA